MTEERKKCILVTGGAGFIGSHLCRELVSRGYRVISLDNYFTGSPDNHVEGVEYRKGHTRDIFQVISEKPDTVFHLGEYSRVEKSFEDPIELVWDLNTAGTFSVLEFCRRNKCKVVYAGSSTKFSHGGEGKNMSPYAWTKSSNTDLVKNYGEWYGLDYAIAYFYNVYGAGEINSGPYSTVIGVFKNEYASGLPITVVSPGTQRRCFTHVSDIVSGLCLVSEYGHGDGYEIGHDQSYSIQEVADLFESEHVIMLPERKGNRLDASIDNTKVRAFGWEPRVSLKEHIASFIHDTKKADVSKQRVLVFSTTFYPNEGPAELALRQLIEKMPDIHFDIITSAYKQERTGSTVAFPNADIYMIGNGNVFDKYRLLYFGYKKAVELSGQHSYAFFWSIMASYGGIAAALARKKKMIPLLISFADQKFDRVSIFAKIVVRFICKNADQLSFLTVEQDHGVSRIDPNMHLTSSNRKGDVFANQIRFLYNDILRQLEHKSDTKRAS